MSRRTPKRLVTAFLLALLTMAAVPAFAHAAPKATTPPVAYDVSRAGNDVRIAVKNGTITLDDNRLSIRNKAGATVFGMPLNYRLEDRQFPIKARSSDHRAVLTPVTDKRQSTKVAPAEVAGVRKVADKQMSQWAEPRTKRERDDQALARFNQQMSAGMTVSSIVATTVGAVVGGTVGCVLGLPFFGVGCIPAMLAGASVGSIGGLIVGGGGTLINSGMQYFNTINAPFKAPRKDKPRR